VRVPIAIFGLACAVIASAPAAAQTCGSPLVAAVGDTPFATVPNTIVNLTGLCDVTQLGADIVYNPAWLRFRAPATGPYVIQTCGSVNFDSRLAVFTDCSSLASVIACNDDTAGCNLTQGIPWASQVTISATAGTDYYIAAGSFALSINGTGSVRIIGEGASNDGSSCATALVATDGLNGFGTDSSTEDVDLAGLCDPGPNGDDVLHRVRWFRYTASQTGLTEVSTCGLAPFDTRIAVFSTCGLADVLACNDDASGCAGFTSAVTFATVAGQDYLVAIGGFSAADAGAGQFRVVPGVPPPPACGTAAHACCTASSLPFCSDGACCALVCAEDPFCCSADGSWDETCALRAGVLCTACGAGSCDLPGAAATEVEPCGDSLNAGCDGREFSTIAIAPGASVAGSFWADGDLRDTDWYEFQAPFGGTATVTLHSRGPGRVFLVDDQCPPAVLASSPEFEASCPASISACVLPGTYRIVVAMTVFSGFPCATPGGRNDYVLVFDLAGCDAVPPANDDCAAAESIGPLGGSAPFDTRLSTDSGTALPASCDEGNGLGFVRDVWYSWTPVAGVARVTTCDSAGFDTRLAAYASCAGALVACNDDGDGCGSFTSTMTFRCDGSTTYLVRLGGYDSAGTGTVRFEVFDPPANDECAGAFAVGADPVDFDTRIATDSTPTLPALCDEGYGMSMRQDLWYRWTAPCSGVATVSTCSSASFDTRLAAYDECEGTLVGCNDDFTGCGGLTSRMQFPATAGAEYLLRVGAHAGSGIGTLTVTCGDAGSPPPANDACTGAIAVVAGSSPIDNSLSTSNPPSLPGGGCSGTGFYNDVWLSYSPARGGLTEVSLCGGLRFDTRLEIWDGCPELGGAVLACNDDACDGQSRIQAVLACGGTYLIRVGAFAANGFGAGTISIAEGPLPCDAPCRADVTNDRLVNGSDLGTLLLNWGGTGPGDLDGSGSVNGADIALLLSQWGPCP
jgi:hypothetical protein